jgi:hypothetical protein
MTRPFSAWEAAINESSDDGAEDEDAALEDGVFGAALVVPPELEQLARHTTAAAATRGRAVRRIFPTFAKDPFRAVDGLLSAIAAMIIRLVGTAGNAATRWPTRRTFCGRRP